MGIVLVGVGALGLAVGSFLNVVIHRVPRAESLSRPGSRCPACATPIRARHNVPVLGWLLLRGRCATCRTPISPRYPLVEITTAVLFVAVAARFGRSPALPAFLYLAAIAVALAVIDIAVKRLPDPIVLPSYAVAAGLLLVASAVSGNWPAAVRAVLAMAVLWTGYFLLAWIYPQGMGFGDVKLAGLIGLYLGWLGWKALAVGAFAGFVLGGLVGVALLLARRAGRRTAFPFGPSMLGGAFVAVFLGGPIATWYLSLLLPA